MSTSNYLQTAQNVFDTELVHILDQRNALDENFSKAIELILNTKNKIILCGLGKSGIVAKKISVTLASIGLSTTFLHAAEASHGDIGNIREGDLMIILSNSGSSHELINVIEYCTANHIPIISILSNTNSVLFSSSTVNILIQPNCEVMELIKVPTTSTTLMTMIGDAIAVCVAQSKKLSQEEYKHYHPGGSIGSSLKTVNEIMRSGDALSIVYQDSLMPDVILSITEKSLGCAIVVDKDLNILGIITDGDLRRHVFTDLIHLSVEEVMSSNPKCITPDTLIVDALKYMNYKKITSILVASNNKLVGLAHIHDCIKSQPLSVEP